MAQEWNLAGTYFEACNCDVACPCVFLSPPTTGECKALIGWHIDEGRFGDAEVTISNHPLCVTPGQTVVVSKSKRVSFNDHGLQLEVSEKNGFYSPFTYQNS